MTTIVQRKGSPNPDTITVGVDSVSIGSAASADYDLSADVNLRLMHANGAPCRSIVVLDAGSGTKAIKYVNPQGDDCFIPVCVSGMEFRVQAVSIYSTAHGTTVNTIQVVF
jgi:hypothetical protein